MRVLVTGGAGFIGSCFLRNSVLARPDDQFLNVDCLTYAANLQTLESIADCPNYEFSRTDITDEAAVMKVFEAFQPDLVVHFAAESHVDRSILGPGAFVQTNIVGTHHLLEAARKIKESKDIVFHHVSTDEVYGSLGAEGFFTETTPYDPSSPYSATKASSDHLVRAYGRTFGLQYRITNCSNNYGPYQFPEKLIPVMIEKMLSGQPLPVYGEGKNIRDWLFVDDHVAALWAVIEKGRMGETYNIGGNSELTNIDLVHRLCEVVASKSDKTPEQLKGLISYVKDRPGHDMRYAIDASKLRDECGWTPAESLESGLEKTVAWYLDNRKWVESVTSGEYRQWMDANYSDRTAGDSNSPS